ncbi:MAG TPA: hypothetical protein VGX23_15950 [Actinocrinis sp.]|nr:hypothetical protein [Actinocrinis sp.]
MHKVTPNGERYIPGRDTVGDECTFAKCNKVPHGLEAPNATSIDMTGMNFQQFYDAVFAELQNLAGG